MEHIFCPVCGKQLNLDVDEDLKVDFDMHKANQRCTCFNCKRKIKYRVVPKRVLLPEQNND